MVVQCGCLSQGGRCGQWTVFFLFCKTWNSRNSLVIISISWFSWDYWVNSPLLLLLLMKVMMMAREGERADNRIKRVSSECPTTTPHVEKWKFDIRSFCSVPGITGKTDPLVVVSGVPGGGEVKPLIHLSQQQQKSQEESSTTNHPPTCPTLRMALLHQGIPDTPIEKRPLSQ